jgi:hypothetical protein
LAPGEAPFLLSKELQVQSNVFLHRPTLALLGALWLSGCANVKVTSEWQDGAPKDPSFARVLVVAVSPDGDQRCEFEHALVARIQSASTKAIASCDAVTDKGKLTRASIDQAIASQQIDGVVATFLISQKWDLQEGGTHDTRGGGYYKPTDSGYGTYGVPVVYADFQAYSSVMVLKGTVDVTTKVYETRGATLIYVMDTAASDLESTDVGRATVATSIADRLHRDKLIR